MSTLQVENLIGPTSGSNANKVIIPSGQTLDASNGFVAPAGHVIQVVDTSNSNQIEYTGVNYIDTSTTATITPKFSTSKILVIHSAGGIFLNHDTEGTFSGNSALLQLKRNGVVTNFNQSRWMYHAGGRWTGINWSFSYVDTPSTTSALTYLITIGKDQSSGNIRYNDHDGTISGNPRLATLTLMEIAQ
jgi:hypothetical protein